MPAAAFAPGERAGSDQHRDRVHVAEFVIGDGAAGRSRRVRPKLIAGQGEAFARANDAAVAPSQIAQRGFGDGGAAGRFEREGLGGGCGSLRHCAACARAEHESFEERVACQAIGSVNSGAGRFAGRVQIWNAGAPVDIGLNAAHGIMSRRVDWRGVLGEIDAVAQASFVDTREAGAEVVAPEMGEVERDGAGARDFADDGARDDIAGGQLALGMIALHETLAGCIAKDGAFAAQGFREQKARCAGQKEGGGMELDEFDVADFSASTIGGTDAVAGGDIGIRGLAEDAPQSAGGQQNGAAADGGKASGLFVENGGACSASLRVEEQIRHRAETVELDIGERGGLAVKCARDFAAGGIAVSMQDAAAAVRSLAGEQETRAFAVELGSPGDQLFDPGGTFAGEHAHRRGVAEAVAGGDGVLLVEGNFVIVGEGDGDAALCVFGGGLVQAAFGDDQYTPGGGEFDGGAKAGDTAANNQKIGVDFCGEGDDNHMVQRLDCGASSTECTACALALFEQQRN